MTYLHSFLKLALRVWEEIKGHKEIESQTTCRRWRTPASFSLSLLSSCSASDSSPKLDTQTIYGDMTHIELLFVAWAKLTQSEDEATIVAHPF